MATKLAFVTYETPFAESGGIAAVMARLPGYAQIASGLDTIVITPFHHKIEKMNSLETNSVDEFEVSFDNKPIKVDIRCYNDEQFKLSWYFLKPLNTEYFAGSPHPIVLEKHRKKMRRNCCETLFYLVHRWLRHWTLSLIKQIGFY